MPFLEQPKNLDGSMAGDVGFDPLGLSEIDDLGIDLYWFCLLYTSPSPRDQRGSRMPSSA